MYRGRGHNWPAGTRPDVRRATTTGLPEEEQSSEAADIEAAREDAESFQWRIGLELYGAGGWNPEDDTSSVCIGCMNVVGIPPDEEC